MRRVLFASIALGLYGMWAFGADTARQIPPSTAFLESQACLQALETGQENGANKAEQEEHIAIAAKRMGEASEEEKTKIGDQAFRIVRESAQNRGEGKSLDLFTPASTKLLDGIEEVLAATKFATREHILDLLPDPKDSSNDYNQYNRLYQKEFTEFARRHWSPQATARVDALLATPKVREDPSAALPVYWLGSHAGGNPAQFAAPFYQFLGSDRLSEPLIARFYAELTNARWTADAAARAFVAAALSELSKSLFAIDVASHGEVLRDEDWLALVITHSKSPPVDWSAKLVAQQKKAGTPHPRVLALLSQLVLKEGDHQDVFLKAVNDDPRLFLSLHGRGGTTVLPAPWLRLFTSEAARVRSRDVLKGLLLNSKLQPEWPEPLLDVLSESHWPADQGSVQAVIDGILRPIARDANHVARAALLSRVLNGKTPPGDERHWADRWSLAWEAAGSMKLLDKLTVGTEQTTAVGFLVATCVNIQLPQEHGEAIARATQTYGKLLRHIAEQLELSQGSAELDEQIIRELCALFKKLGSYPWPIREIEEVNAFWDRCAHLFNDAAGIKDRKEAARKMAASLRLMFRILQVVREPDRVEPLVGLCQKVFSVRSDTPFRVLPPEERKRQAELFREISACITELLPAFDPTFRESIIPLLEDSLYFPVLRTDRVLADAAPEGGSNPWLDLLAVREAASKPEGCRRLLAVPTTMPYANCPAQMKQLAKACLTQLGINLWERPDGLSLCSNFGFVVIKSLLDETEAELLKDGSRPGVVLDLFLGRAGDVSSPRRLMIEDYRMTACDYPVGLMPKATNVQVARVQDFYPWLKRLVLFQEFRLAPLTDNQRSITAAEIWKETAALGELVLPPGKWQRGAVPGAHRYELLTLMNEAMPPTGLADLLEFATIAMTLPNREEHTQDNEKMSLPAYAATRLSIARAIDWVIAAGASPRQVFDGASAILRLRFSLEGNDAAVAELDAALRRHQQTLRSSGPDGSRFCRALFYDEYFLRLANPARKGGGFTIGDRVALMLERIVEDLNLPNLQGKAPIELVLEFLDRGGDVGNLLGSITQADIIAFAPLVVAIRDPQTDPELGFQIFAAMAMRLPWYAATVEDLAGGREKGIERLDRLVLFSLLSGDVKSRLVNWIDDQPEGDKPAPRSPSTRPGPDPAHQRHLAHLLLEHNALAMQLAGRVFDDPALLKLTLEKRSYDYPTIDFAILATVRCAPAELQGHTLLAASISGCSQNISLAMKRGRMDDARVIRFLFGELVAKGGSGGPTAGQMPSLDAVLRTCAMIARSQRYANDPDAKLRKAAETFQTSAKQLREAPPALAWFNADHKLFTRAQTYFRCLELAADSIASPPSKDTADDLGELWCRMLLPQPERPEWRLAFARSLSRIGKDSAITTREVLVRQRDALTRVVEGEGESDQPQDELRQRGLKALLGRPEVKANAELKKFVEACAAAGRAAFSAALLGEGLQADDRFPAMDFLETPGGPCRPLRTLVVASGATRPAPDFDAVLDGIAWMEAWGLRCQKEPYCNELLGLPLSQELARETPGLGCGAIGPRHRPASYAAAVYGAFWRGAAEELGPLLLRLCRLHASLRRSLGDDPAITVDESMLGDCDSTVLQLIAFRLDHNAAMARLATTPAAKSISPATWDWLKADAHTAAWVLTWLDCGNPATRPATPLSCTREGLPLLRPSWAPFAAYAKIGPELCPEAAALGLTSQWVATETASQRLMALLQLYDLIEESDGKIALTAQARQGFARLVHDAPATIRQSLSEDAATCAAAVEEWTSLRTWIKLADSRSWTTVEPVPGYKYRSLPAAQVRAAGLGPISAAVEEWISWSPLPALAPLTWTNKYNDKVKFIRRLEEWRDRRASARGTAGLNPFAVLLEVAARCEPAASPFQASLVDGQIRLTEPEGKFTPECLRQMGRQAALEHLTRMCLVQREIDKQGNVRYLKAGFMGYVDLLKELTQEGPGRSAEGGAR